jgi:glutamate racemase
MSRCPIIGVFDSGFGGLTVLKELAARIPGADYLYFGDTARLPYGSKSAETVARYALEAARFLEREGMEMLVVACNTATALALPNIRERVKVPVEGVVEPGAECAAAVSQRRKVVVIGTEATIASHAYLKALQARGISVCEKACPLLVPLIEEGWIEHPVTQQVAHVYLDEFFHNFETGPDTLLLGCTHYPLIKPILRSVAPWRVEIVDSAESTANRVAEQLRIAPAHPDREREHGGAPRMRFFATDSVAKFRRLGERFLGHPVGNVEHVDIGG